MGVKKGRCFSKRRRSSEPAVRDKGLDGLEEEVLERRGEPKPMLPLEMRSRMIFWRPTKAPVKMKRMLSVRTL